jgi:Tfp pilus assembly protein PilO
MTRRIRMLLIGLGIVVVAVLVFFLVLRPIMGDIDELHSQIEDEQTLIQRATIELQQAERTRADGRRNQAKLLELAKMIPADTELPSLILQIQDLADKAGIDWIRITPQASRDGGTGTYQILPLALEFSGTFFDINDFIYRAEQMVAGPGRLLTVKSVSLRVVDAGLTPGVSHPELGVTMNMYAFLLPGGWERPAPAGATATPSTGEQ